MNNYKHNIYDNTETLDELWNVLGDEAIGHAKYKLFAKQAEKEGHYDAAALFNKLASDEFGHAEMWINELGMVGDTVTNLDNAIIDETNDYINNYPHAAAKAENEGLDELSAKFLKTAEVEKMHSAELKALSDSIKNGTNNNSAVPVKRRCANCGYTVTSESTPDHCPLCGYTGNHMMLVKQM